VLPNDYRGIHLYLGLSAITLCASALTGTRLLPTPRRGLQVAFSVGALCAALALLVSPSSAAALAIERSVSAAVSPLVGELKSRLGRRAADDAAATALVPKNEWLTSREKAPPIPPSKPPLLGKDPIVLFITVDALRADLVTGKYDDKLPTFRKLRERAVWFSEARSAGTLTKVSLAALFQSTYFSQQLWTTNAGPPNVRRDKTPRFPEFLQKAGVQTVNFRSISWLRNGNLIKGFDEDIDVGAEDRRSYTPSKAVFEKLLPRVKQFGSGPTFLWTHLSDPHAPYTLGGKKGSEFDRYLAEVALVDRQLARLLTTLRDAGLEERTLLVISADHGESFGEHHSDTHGTTVYDETMHVPLFFVAPPGVLTPRKVDELVSLVDLAPTMLDLFGLPTPGHMMGQSLVPFLRGESPKLSRYVAAEARQFRTLITPDKMKVVEDLKSGRVELYDLAKDPLELHNLASDREALRLPKATLDAFFRAHELTKDGYERPIVR
jgi:arylsulfatase A-like enzyme